MQFASKRSVLQILLNKIQVYFCDPFPLIHNNYLQCFSFCQSIPFKPCNADPVVVWILKKPIHVIKFHSSVNLKKPSTYNQVTHLNLQCSEIVEVAEIQTCIGLESGLNQQTKG